MACSHVVCEIYDCATRLDGMLNPRPCQKYPETKYGRRLKDGQQRQLVGAPTLNGLLYHNDGQEAILMMGLLGNLGRVGVAGVVAEALRCRRVTLGEREVQQTQDSHLTPMSCIFPTKNHVSMLAVMKGHIGLATCEGTSKASIRKTAGKRRTGVGHLRRPRKLMVSFVCRYQMCKQKCRRRGMATYDVESGGSAEAG